jgi:hypothetical protein
MTIKDKNDKTLKNGDVIDIHQTVNGQNLFVVFFNTMALETTLDIRYHHDITRKYEYDKKELLAPSKFNSEVEFEIVGNVLPVIKNTNSIQLELFKILSPIDLPLCQPSSSQQESFRGDIGDRVCLMEGEAYVRVWKENGDTYEKLTYGSDFIKANKSIFEKQ